MQSKQKLDEENYEVSLKQENSLYWRIWIEQIKNIIENECFREAFEQAYT